MVSPNTHIPGLKLRVALQLDLNETKFQQFDPSAQRYMPRVSRERYSGRTICSTESKNKNQYIHMSTSHKVTYELVKNRYICITKRHLMVAG